MAAEGEAADKAADELVAGVMDSEKKYPACPSRAPALGLSPGHSKATY